MLLARCQSFFTFEFASLPVIRGIMRRAIGVVRPSGSTFLDSGNMLAHLATGHEGRIDKVSLYKRREDGTIFSGMVRLAADRSFPIEPEPCEIFLNGSLEFGGAACRIDILYAQQETAVDLCRHVMIEDGGKRMAEV